MLETIVDITRVPRKHWQPFEAISPGSVPFAGFLCRQESSWLGTLAVTEIAGRERLEFIPAMPKIHYPYHRDPRTGPRVIIPLPPNAVDARFNEKLDGTCIVWYALPLPGDEGETSEVIPRTRLQPVLSGSRWGDWPALLQEVLPDRRPVERAVREQAVVLAFELWGYRNPHLVRYDVPLALTLHTAIRQRKPCGISPQSDHRTADGSIPHGKPLSYRRLADIARRYGFDLVKSMAVEELDADHLAQAYRDLQAQMEAHNRAAGPDTYVEEGAVLMISTRDRAAYWKCKPPSIEEIHFAVGASIGKEIIRQAILKLAEQGYDFDQGRLEDLEAELEKDFDPRDVETQRDLIGRVWLDFLVEQQRCEWLRRLVQESGLDPVDTAPLMRHLSQHYPKKQMRWVYNTVRQLYGA